MSQVPVCAKCNKTLSGKVKIVDGKRYHEACLVAQPATPVSVSAPVHPAMAVAAPIPPVEEIPEDAVFDQDGNMVQVVSNKSDAPEMRQVMWFNWQDQDGTVFNHTIRGRDFNDFVSEFDATKAWILSQGGVFVNSGKSQYVEAPKQQTATQPQGSKPSVPASVAGQTVKFEHDGVNYMVGEVKELRVKYLDKSNQYVVNAKVPPFLQFGVIAWKEVSEPIWGDLSKLSLADPLPVTDAVKYAVFSLKEDGKPNKIVEFRATKQ